MACCLTTSSHYLNQCRLIIKCVLWDSPGSNSQLVNLIRNMCSEFAHLKLLTHLPGDNQLMKFAVHGRRHHTWENRMYYDQCKVHKMLLWFCLVAVISLVVRTFLWCIYPYPSRFLTVLFHHKHSRYGRFSCCGHFCHVVATHFEIFAMFDIYFWGDESGHTRV